MLLAPLVFHQRAKVYQPYVDQSPWKQSLENWEWLEQIRKLIQKCYNEDKFAHRMVYSTQRYAFPKERSQYLERGLEREMAEHNFSFSGALMEVFYELL